MSTRTFTTRELAAWKVHQNNLQENSYHADFATCIDTVFKAPDDGKFYRVTLMYAHDYGPWEGEPDFDGVEVFPVERVVTQYVTDPEEEE